MTRICLLVLILMSTNSFAQELWGHLAPGQYSVGFKVIRERDHARNARPMQVSLWYPSASPTAGEQVLFKDYLAAGIINQSFSQPSENEKTLAYDDFHKTLERPFIYGSKIPDAAYYHVLDLPTAAKWSIPEADRKFPAVVMSSEPESLSVTAEYLASNGFVVAAVNAPYGGIQPPDSLLWVQPTEDIVWLVSYIAKLKNVDNTKITALGFGGGIQSPFYLAMKTDQIKALVNLEGGVFGPRSLTDKSVDYDPTKMKTPMLHIVTRAQQSEDDVRQQQALVNAKLYRAMIQSEGLRHHDFSIFGRVLNKGLRMRGDLSDIADQTYVNAHKMILEFLSLAVAGKAASFPVDRRYMPFISISPE